MDFNKFFQSKTFRIGLIFIGALIVLLLVFKAGVFVGYKKAQFSYRWGENYHRNFAGPRSGFFGDFRRGLGDRDYINAHGTFGSIIKIDPAAGSGQAATLIVKGSDNTEKTILVSDKTTIKSRREAIKIKDLKVDDRIVIIGSPNEQGQIEAKFIRLFR
jgi:hypothetical protein